MRVHCVTTGAVRAKRQERGIGRYLRGRWRDEAEPVNAFAIEHEAGVCLFDTGQTAAAAEPGYFPRWHPFFRLSRFELSPSDEAAEQLRALGIEADAVRWIVLSHLHTDHVGGVGSFPSAEVLVSRIEWLRATGIAGRLRGYLPQYWPAGLAPRLVDFHDGPVGPFDRSHDVAGDGRLRLVPTPGHTPGHTALLVTGERRTFLLGGDAAHSAGGLEREARAVSSFCRERRVVFLAAHDPAAPRLAEAAS